MRNVAGLFERNVAGLFERNVAGLFEHNVAGPFGFTCTARTKVVEHVHDPRRTF